jgi:2-iminobutanoate/2-iminopropanoate deaminase
LRNLAEDNGFNLIKDAVKNVLYLVDMGDFAKVNEIYKKYFPTDFPARTCIAAKELPKGAKVEIESVLFKGGV